MDQTTLHKCFKFDMIPFTGCGVITEKPRVGHLLDVNVKCKM